MLRTTTQVYRSQQIREIEHLAKEQFHISGPTLMQRAGQAAFDFLVNRWPKAKRISVLCGAGNNGGDGYVLAQLAHEQGFVVTVWALGDVEQLKNEAKIAYQSCRDAKVPIYSFHESMTLSESDVLIDAICGIGLQDALHAKPLAAVNIMRRTKIPILSLDIPSGIDADTGSVWGAAVSASATVTFIGLKPGLLTSRGIAHTGELITATLQLPDELYQMVKPVAEKTDRHHYAYYLQPRPRDWHKGLSGHVVIIGGYPGFSGAPRMAGLAALRMGAGLVSIATHPEHAHIMNTTCPELMCHAITHAEDLAPLVAKADVIVLGPGLSQTTWSQSLWNYACNQAVPMVIDADGLNLLAKEAAHVSRQTQNLWVLTPHPGEAARLLGESVAFVQANRFAACEKIQQRYNSICVLKGAGSIIYTGNTLPAVCTTGNPGMASAGMGDILSGVIAGLMAQGVPAVDAAKLGVHLHGMAGDCAAKLGERGTLATDLLPYLRQLANDTDVQD